MSKSQRCLVLLLSLGFNVSALADVCVTFADSVDNFEGQFTASRSNHYSLVMLETLFNRAAYGSVIRKGDSMFMGWTKNTNTASVTYQCAIDAFTRVGPCEILVSDSSGTATILNDFATLEIGNCSALSATAREPSPLVDELPLGESAE